MPVNSVVVIINTYKKSASKIETLNQIYVIKD